MHFHLYLHSNTLVFGWSSALSLVHAKALIFIASCLYLNFSFLSLSFFIVILFHSNIPSAVDHSIITRKFPIIGGLLKFRKIR